MKIAYFSESFKPYLSGVTVSIDTLVNHLEEFGHETHIFAPHYPNIKEKEKNIYRFPSLPSPYPGFRVALPFHGNHSKVLKNIRPDIIHTHSPYGLGLKALGHAKKESIPIVYTLHTLFDKYLHNVPLISDQLIEPLLMTYLRWFCNQCQAIIVPTEKTKEYLLKHKIGSPIEIIPSGVPFGKIKQPNREKIRESLKLPKNAIILIYCGRLSKEKNILFLLKAFTQIHKEEKNIYLLLVGGGPQRKQIEHFAAKGKIKDKIIFTGKASHDDVFSYLYAADIFIFSSKTETQGLAIAEAAAIGLPTVAVKAEGVIHSVIDGKTGFLVPEDIGQFKEKALMLIKMKALRDEMGQAARIFAEETFCSKLFSQRVLELYERML